jgi:hypothetical protein
MIVLEDYLDGLLVAVPELLVVVGVLSRALNILNAFDGLITAGALTIRMDP